MGVPPDVLQRLRAIGFVCFGVVLVILFAQVRHDAATRSFLDLDTKGQIEIVDDIIRALGPDAAWSYLKSSYIVAGGTRESKAEPHNVAHVVGEAFYRTYGAAGLSHCENVFSYACYHAFADMWIREEGAPGIQALMKACPQALRGPCAHGAGRGLISSEGDPHRAFEQCMSHFEGTERHYCAEGMFGRYWDAEPGMNTTLAWRECTQYPKDYRTNCMYVLFGSLRGRAGSTPEAVWVCARATDPDDRTSCVRSIGSYIERLIARGDASIIERECTTIDAAADKEACFVGAATQIIATHVGDWRASVKTLCGFVAQPRRLSCERGTN